MNEEKEQVGWLLLDDVRFAYDPKTEFLGPVNMNVGAGDFWTIVGPNGAGKSTLLRLMAGLLRARGGRVGLSGKPINRVSRRERAQFLAFVPQRATEPPDHTAGRLVLMGRFPRRSMGLFDTADDREVAQQAMELTETSEFMDRPMDTLSGGEAQRVRIAAALASEPNILILDEPTAGLDLYQQLSVFSLLRELAVEKGMAVVAVTHDVNLAGRYGTHALLLHEGKVAGSGRPVEVLTPENLAPIYGVAMVALQSGWGEGHGWIVPLIAEREGGS